MVKILGFSTTGDIDNDLLLGLDIVSLQKWVVLYLVISVLAFALVWLVGTLRQR
ncbi:cytochrome B6 [cyanobiont of Ornithocercus magnificus]|nr:cytochrome B6 [cyanobiont of Ornithocercus magnificus]